MGRRTGAGSGVDAWLAKVDRPQRDLVISIRTLIREAAPELEETMKWGQPCYVHDGANVCYIAPIADRVNVGFFRGADLDDPDHLLEGTGKSLRHVKVWRGKRLRKGALRALVRCAAAMSDR